MAGSWSDTHFIYWQVATKIFCACSGYKLYLNSSFGDSMSVIVLAVILQARYRCKKQTEAVLLEKTRLPKLKNWHLKHTCVLNNKQQTPNSMPWRKGASWLIALAEAQGIYLKTLLNSLNETLRDYQQWNTSLASAIANATKGLQPKISPWGLRLRMATAASVRLALKEVASVCKTLPPFSSDKARTNWHFAVSMDFASLPGALQIIVPRE